MLKVKYFAFGSNINYERLKSRVAFFSNLEKGIFYTLKNYKLVFNAGFQCFANIEFSQGSEVEGLLYDLTPEQFEILDRYEALYHKEYFQIDENTIGCVYVANHPIKTKQIQKPYLEYLNIIIDGCKKAGLTNTFYNLVDFKTKNYKLKKNKHLK